VGGVGEGEIQWIRMTWGGKEERKKKGIMGISSFHPHYTGRRSRFAERFLKTAPSPPEEPELELFWVESEPSQMDPAMQQLAETNFKSAHLVRTDSYSVLACIMS
jgi:hypothetical protein